MVSVQQSIGAHFENYLINLCPDLDTRMSDNNVPDFFHPSGFWIETKCGNRQWGCRVKQYQIHQESFLQNQTIYLFGMHQFDNAISRLQSKTEIQRQMILDKNINYTDIYLVSSEIVSKVMKRETRTSKKGMVYCMIKPSILINILTGRAFIRHGKRVLHTGVYYGFNRKNYFIHSEGPVKCFLDKKFLPAIRFFEDLKNRQDL